MNPRPPAIFLQGSIPRHVVIMTATGSVGLISVFVVDVKAVDGHSMRLHRASA